MDDAKSATQAALAEGIVPGGGVALLRCEAALKKLKHEGDEARGAQDHRQCSPIPLTSHR